MRQPLIVLKFGGSVLAGADTLPRAVHEIDRWRRSGFGVVAVVSALAGVTDVLLRESRAYCTEPSPEAVAALVGNGERQSAAPLGLCLDGSGVPARVLSAEALGLRATGSSLDARPVALDVGRVRRALEAGDVVVIPGFVAHDGAGRGVLLGRGGSDLTALFLAARLGAARCRLVKDVDGLYAADPTLPGPPPRRYRCAGWDDALATDGTIIQRKALQFARANRLSFELGRANGTRPTRIGGGASRACGAPDRPVRLRVALLGCGTVGGAVWQRLAAQPELFEVCAIAVRNRDRPRRVSPPHRLLTTDALAAARCGVDVVVEALGDVHTACSAITAALCAGAHVVTANKAVVAAHGSDLEALAQDRGLSLRWSAAAGGAVPVLETVRRLAHRTPVLELDGVLNGTTNFVLDAVAAGASFDAAVMAARSAGLTEGDGERDLSGRDAADKLVLVHHAATELWLDPAAVCCTPVSVHLLEALRRPGTVVRQVAALRWTGRTCVAEVRPQALPVAHPLARVSGEGNAVRIATRDGELLLRGRGAGGPPTATSVLGDLLALHRALGRESARRAESRMGTAVPIRPTATSRQDSAAPAMSRDPATG